MVLFYHLAELVKIPLPANLGFVSSHFGLGVPLFYALSGFVLSYGYASRLEGRPEIMAFYVRRLFRIAPLFYTMLALWLVVNYVLWDKVFTSQTLFLNVTFLFGLVPGFHESVVWAGWSIGIEMLFYLVFPVLILFAHDVKSSIAFYIVALVLGTAIQNALLGMDVGSYAYMNLGTHLPSFAAGIACFRIWEGMHFYRSKLAGWTLLSVALLLAVVLVVWKPLYLMLWQLPFGNLERNVWSMVFGASILAVCITSVPALERGPLRRLGKLSFSLPRAPAADGRADQARPARVGRHACAWRIRRVPGCCDGHDRLCLVGQRDRVPFHRDPGHRSGASRRRALCGAGACTEMSGRCRRTALSCVAR